VVQEIPDVAQKDILAWDEVRIKFNNDINSHSTKLTLSSTVIRHFVWFGYHRIKEKTAKYWHPKAHGWGNLKPDSKIDRSNRDSKNLEIRGSKLLG